MASRTCNRIEIFPAALGVIMICGIILVFVIAVLRKDVTPYMPFISEAGAKPPEAGLFSLFLDICASLGFLTLILRYFIVDECNQQPSKLLTFINSISLLIGIVAMVGMMVVAAYPMISIAAAHNFGALVLFACSVVYGICHTWISYKMYPTYNSLAICRLRLVVIILSGMSFLTTLIGAPLAISLWGGANHMHWTGSKTPDDQGFNLLVASSVAEWLMAFFFVMYFFTFTKEFKKVKVQLNVHLLVTHFDEVVVGNNDETNPLL